MYNVYRRACFFSTETLYGKLLVYAHEFLPSFIQYEFWIKPATRCFAPYLHKIYARDVITSLLILKMNTFERNWMKRANVGTIGYNLSLRTLTPNIFGCVIHHPFMFIYCVVYTVTLV